MADLIEVASFEATAVSPGITVQDDYLEVASFEATAGFPGNTFALGGGTIGPASFHAGAQCGRFRLRES